MSAEPQDFGRFVAMPGARLALFLTKIPYLVAECLALWVLCRIFPDRETRSRLLVLWALSPAIVYPIYIFGRFEAYAILFLTLSLWAASRQRLYAGALFLGLALTCRATFVLLAPVFALALAGQRARQLGLLIVTLVPQLAVIALFEMALGARPAYTSFGSNFAAGPLAPLLAGAGSWFVSPYFLTYFLLLFWLDKAQKGVETFVVGSALTILLIFGLAAHSAHYIAWLVPFFLVLVVRTRNLIIHYWLFFVVWGAYWAINTDVGVFTAYLFSPAFGELTVPRSQPLDWLTDSLAPVGLNARALSQIMRTLLLSTVVWVAWNALAKQPSEHS